MNYLQLPCSTSTCTGFTDPESRNSESTQSWRRADSSHTTVSRHATDSASAGSRDTINSWRPAAQWRATDYEWRPADPWRPTNSFHATEPVLTSSGGANMPPELLPEHLPTAADRSSVPIVNKEPHRTNPLSSWPEERPERRLDRNIRPAGLPPRGRSRRPRATEANLSVDSQHPRRMAYETRTTRLPKIIEAPPPPYSIFDAYIDQSPAERTWEERLAAYDVLDHHHTQVVGKLPKYSLSDPLAATPIYWDATNSKRSDNTWLEIGREIKRAAKAIGKGIGSRFVFALREPGIWRAFT